MPTVIPILTFVHLPTYLPTYLQAPGIIIVEDDLLFSPDFLNYFESNAPILEMDSTTFVLRYVGR